MSDVETLKGERARRPPESRLLRQAADAVVAKNVLRQGEAVVDFISLSDPIDTASVGGRQVLDIAAALERSFIVERTQAGLRAAKKRGAHLGRPHLLSPARINQAGMLIEKGESPRAVAHAIGVGKSALYRHLQARQPLVRDR
jgi:DNA invertase Pin-like site-specific DNA recombinase